MHYSPFASEALILGQWPVAFSGHLAAGNVALDVGADLHSRDDVLAALEDKGPRFTLPRSARLSERNVTRANSLAIGDRSGKSCW